jgi:hypothetical protein
VPLAAQLTGDSLGRRTIDIRHENDRAFTSEPARDPAADAVAGAGDKRNEAFETLHMPAASVIADTIRMPARTDQGEGRKVANGPAISAAAHRLDNRSRGRSYT